jgi:predicted DNA binding protein
VLSDRQREAVRAALDIGYYDQPRGATHEDVAAALDCAPSTASEHLRKAEAELVRAAMR